VGLRARLLTRGHILLCSSTVNRRKTKENTLTVTRWRGKGRNTQ